MFRASLYISLVFVLFSLFQYGDSFVVSGRIYSSFNQLNNIQGATISLLPGYSTISNYDGTYSITVPSGTYQVNITYPGKWYSDPVVVVQSDVYNYDFALVDIQTGLNFEFLVYWGSKPLDLDAYLFTSYGCNTSWENPTGCSSGQSIGRWAYDDNNGWGPESIILNNAIPGTYDFYVNLVSSNTQEIFSQSGNGRDPIAYISSSKANTVPSFQTIVTSKDPSKKWWYAISLRVDISGTYSWNFPNTVVASPPTSDISTTTTATSTATTSTSTTTTTTSTATTATSTATTTTSTSTTSTSDLTTSPLSTNLPQLTTAAINEILSTTQSVVLTTQISSTTSEVVPPISSTTTLNIPTTAQGNFMTTEGTITDIIPTLTTGESSQTTSANATTSTDGSNNTDDKKSKKVSAALIAGIVAGSLALILIILVLFLFLKKRRNLNADLIRNDSVVKPNIEQGSMKAYPINYNQGRQPVSLAPIPRNSNNRNFINTPTTSRDTDIDVDYNNLSELGSVRSQTVSPLPPQYNSRDYPPSYYSRFSKV